jgi:predicted ATPase/class 3 adenylate cyclase
MPTGVISFLFTDVEGSTRLWEAHPDEMRDALEDHDAIARAAVERYDGYVFTTAGDAFAIAFRRPIDAVNAGVEIHQRLADHAWGDNVTVRVRMGLHVGEATERDGDYFGPTLNRAARISSAAHGGQFVISSLTKQLLGADATVDSLIDLGEHYLKDLGAPERIWQVPVPGIVADHPELQTLSRQRTNLPQQATEFIGRDRDREAVASHLQASRVVTIHGLGGMGKTRLSLQVAADVFSNFVDGVWFVELAPTREPSAVPFAVAETLGYSALGTSPLEAVIGGIGDRSMLIVLDNCEHIIEAARELVDELLRRCPNLRLLVTSRFTLNVAGELVHILEPMEGRERGSAAVALFVARAASANPALVVDEARIAVIGELVERLDGIPLAIELAAARVRSLTPEQILERLDRRFRLLQAKGGVVERHQRLVDTIEWSYAHLSEDEQLLFRRLSVFAGPFSIAAIEAICTDELIDEFDVLDLIEGLVDQSMVLADLRGSVARYRLLESLREFGIDKLGENVELRDRHADYFARAVAEAGARSMGVDEGRALEEMEMIWDDVRLGWFHAYETGDVARSCALAGHITFELMWRSRLEPSKWAQSTLAMPGFGDQAASDRLGVYNVAAAGLMHGVENERAIQYAGDGTALFDEMEVGDLDHRVLQATSVLFFTGQLKKGVDSIAKLCDRIGPEPPDQLLRNLLMISAASMHGYLGDGDRAVELAELGLRSANDLGPTWRTLAEWDRVRYDRDSDPRAVIEMLAGFMDQFESVGNRFLRETARRHLLGLQAQFAELSEHMADTAAELETLDVSDPRVPTGWLLTSAVALLKARSWFDAGVLLEWQNRYRVAPILPERQVQLDELVPQMEAALDNDMRRSIGEKLDAMDLTATVAFAIESLTVARSTLAESGASVIDA